MTSRRGSFGSEALEATDFEDLLGRGAPPYVDGEARVRPAAGTAEDLEQFLSRFGITRVADVTGLDRIGIPVVMVVRPNARSLAVSQGKGRDLVAARVSGIMESIELATAERSAGPTWMASHLDLVSAGHRVIDPERLPLARDTNYRPSLVLPWMAGIDLSDGATTFVPWELVHANALVPLAPGSGTFVRSTNGLASGNVPGEAVLHGLCELVERDALALWEHATPESQQSRRVDPSTVDDPSAIELLQRYDEAALDVLVWDLSGDVGLPVYRVVIVDRHAHPVLKPLPAAFGAGCHPRRSIALVRALTEAAQSRLTAISGARDDLTRERYRSFQGEAALRHHRELAGASARGAYGSAPDRGGTDLAADVATVLDRLRGIGVESVAALPLGPVDLPWSVVRVVASDLEGPTESPQYRPGVRVMTASEGRGA